MVVRRGYKQTEVGVIPEDWEVMPFARAVGSYIDYRGRTPRKLGLNWGEGDILALSANNVQMGWIDPNKEAYFGSDELYRKWMVQGECEFGDVLMTMEAPLGNIAQIPDSKRYILSQRVLLIKPKRWLLRNYLAHYMRGTFFQAQLALNATGSTAKGIQRSKLDQLPVYIPPTKTEQEAIAEALSDADALIESLEQLVAKKRQLKQGAMQELLTGRRRLPGFEIKRGYKQTEVGVIPADWDVEPLGTVCEIVAGRDLVKADFSPVDSHSHSFPIYSNALANKGLYGYSRSYQFEADRITVTARGDIGHAVHRNARFCAIGRLLVLRSKRACDLRFVTEFINNAVDFAVESTGVPQLTAPQISKYAVALPPTKAEQESIATLLSDMDAEIAALEAKLAKASQIKQGMMQELLTGRIRLV